MIRGKQKTQAETNLNIVFRIDGTNQLGDEGVERLHDVREGAGDLGNLGNNIGLLGLVLRVLDAVLAVAFGQGRVGELDAGLLCLERGVARGFAQVLLVGARDAKEEAGARVLLQLDGLVGLEPQLARRALQQLLHRALDLLHLLPRLQFNKKKRRRRRRRRRRREKKRKKKH